MKTLVMPSETGEYAQFAAIIEETESEYVCLDSFYKFTCDKQYVSETTPEMRIKFVQAYPFLSTIEHLLVVDYAHRTEALGGYVPQSPSHVNRLFT